MSCKHDHSTADSLFYKIPDASFADRSIRVPYHNAAADEGLLTQILESTPPPKGQPEFSSVHLVAPPFDEGCGKMERTLLALRRSCTELNKTYRIHRLSESLVGADCEPLVEYNAIFEVASDLILEGANRASLLVFVGAADIKYDAFAVLAGMLPFRGITVALVTQRREYGDLLAFRTPSGVFAVDGREAPRMGMFRLDAVFGALPSRTFESPVHPWRAMSLKETAADNALAVELPFKIGGLVLPMINHNDEYAVAVRALATCVEQHYRSTGRQEFFPIVSVGETCDALGYGSDVLEALTMAGKCEGFLFVHKSGETFKRSDSYASRELFHHIHAAKARGAKPVIIAVGGGVNGNSIGLIAALTGADFLEVPTTPMHFNDATTSAKKAFSLVQKDVILSKNILGAFYLPLAVFCVGEMFMTISSANAHATVGEATKTMNMLGIANSATGARDYHNILGGVEFASDFTKILRHVGGFEKLVSFITRADATALKARVVALGAEIRTLRSKLRPILGSDSAALMLELAKGRMSRMLRRDAKDATQSMYEGDGVTLVYTKKSEIKSSASIAMLWQLSAMGHHDSDGDLVGMRSSAGSTRSLQSFNEDESDGSDGDDVSPPGALSASDSNPLDGSASSEDLEASLSALGKADIVIDEQADVAQLQLELLELTGRRTGLMQAYRALFHGVDAADKVEIKDFLTTINLEVVKAKAMFLAYSDPFEKYRALLFEYAHTLGHGIEAFANMLYTHAKAEGVAVPVEAQRLHGQCVGMAVLWAGAMSEKLGVLTGDGLSLHQSFVYLFNRHGGFTFAPLRKLCESLGMGIEELCEGVLRVVRRDNKRGYCCSSKPRASVDQLVATRPGLMVKSDDPQAELRYLVEVEESLQSEMLRRAWDGDFDLVADLAPDGQLSFVPFTGPLDPSLAVPSTAVAGHIRSALTALYDVDHAHDAVPATALSKGAFLDVAPNEAAMTA